MFVVFGATIVGAVVVVFPICASYSVAAIGFVGTAIERARVRRVQKHRQWEEELTRGLQRKAKLREESEAVTAELYRQAFQAQQERAAARRQGSRITLAIGDEQEVVGESNYQSNLRRACGGKTPNGAKNPDVIAVLERDPTNSRDENAIRVLVGGRCVGYLPRDRSRVVDRALDELANHGLQATCHATITGGWDRGDGDAGSFGIVLNTDYEIARS